MIGRHANFDEGMNPFDLGCQRSILIANIGVLMDALLFVNLLKIRKE